MNQAPLIQSDPKTAMLARLGLNVPGGETVHKMLLEEANAGRDRLSVDPNNLAPNLWGDPRVKTPYKWGELSETAKHREILSIAKNAGSHTRPYYVCGQYRTNVAEENWVARWYMWHSFRHRDNRRDTDSGGTNQAGGGVGGSQATHGKYYDPVHGTYRQ